MYTKYLINTKHLAVYLDTSMLELGFSYIKGIFSINLVLLKIDFICYE